MRRGGISTAAMSSTKLTTTNGWFTPKISVQRTLMYQSSKRFPLLMFSQKALCNLRVLNDYVILLLITGLFLSTNIYAAFRSDEEILSIKNNTLLNPDFSDVPGIIHINSLLPPDDHPPYPFLPGVSSKSLFDVPAWQIDLIFALAWIRHQLNTPDFSLERRLEEMSKYLSSFFRGSRKIQSSAPMTSYDNDHQVSQKKQLANIEPEIIQLYPVTYYRDSATITKDASCESLGECRLCEKAMDNQEDLFCAIGCEHIFHSHCLFRWLTSQLRTVRGQLAEHSPCCGTEYTTSQSVSRFLSASVNFSEFARLTSMALSHAKQLIEEKSTASNDAVDRNSDIRTYLRIAELSLNDAISDGAVAILMSLEGQEDEHTEQVGSSDIANAVRAYTARGDTNGLLPFVKNPPGWQDVHDALLAHYYNMKIKYPYFKVRQISPLHEVFSQHPYFMTQIPTKETIEGIVSVIRYFQSELHGHLPGQTLVLAGIGSGNCIIERAIVEYFKRSQARADLTIDQSGLIELEPGLLLHCSDKSTRSGFFGSYVTSTMLACEEMDYKTAMTTISAALPGAYILPFSSWAPEENWFESLVNDPSVIGCINLRHPSACEGWQDLFVSRNPKCLNRPAPEGLPVFMARAQEFWRSDFNLLAWGANDQLTAPLKDALSLKTRLSVYYPRGTFNPPELPAEVLYDDTFREQRHKPVNLPENSDLDLDSDWIRIRINWPMK